jgi:uncharacterized membrane protein YidH (DUF202 family)
MDQEEIKKKAGSRRVHMANERTYLAWIRTSISIMAFGFVVEKFALFIRQLSLLLGKERMMGIPPGGGGYSRFLGALLITIGALIGPIAFIRYKRVEKQIDEDTFKPSIMLDLLLGFSVLAIGIFLVIYIIHSV